MIPFLKFTGAKSFSSLQDGELRSQDAPFVIQFDFSGQKAGAIKRYLQQFTNKTVAIRISISASTVMKDFWARTGDNFGIFAERKKENKNKPTTALLLRLVFFRAHTIFSWSPPAYLCVGCQSGMVVINYATPSTVIACGLSFSQSRPNSRAFLR